MQERHTCQHYEQQKQAPVKHVLCMAWHRVGVTTSYNPNTPGHFIITQWQQSQASLFSYLDR
jgi:hypothetical protein